MYMDTVNFENQHFRYFINMAVHGKIHFQPLSTIFDDLTPTLDKSKQLNKVLLEEIQKLVTKLPNQENNFKSPNPITKSPKDNLVINQREEIDNEDENFTIAEPFDSESRVHDLSEDKMEIVNHYDETNEERNFDETTTIQYVKDCMICGERFETTDSYEIHSKIHEVSEEKENWKSLQSNAKEFLTEKETLNIEKLLKCNYCSKSFLSKQVKNPIN